MSKLIYGLQIAILILMLVSCSSAAEQNNLGNSLTTAMDFDDAIIAYSSAQVSDPDNPIPYINVAKAYFEQGNLDIAVEVLEQAILRGDETIQAQAYYNIGNFYFMSQEMDDAIIAYRESLIINPDDSNARQNLELAMFYSSTATPFDDEMKTEPEENQVNPTATPTDLPLDSEDPSPTPRISSFSKRTPEGGIEGDRFGKQGPMTPFPNGTPTSPKAEDGELPGTIQPDENIYSPFSDDPRTPPSNTESGKSW
jgi:tetratricopeptide (TPR) repeat protein